MKSILKFSIVSVVSAVIGGLIVVGALKAHRDWLDKSPVREARNAGPDAVYDDILRNEDGIRNQFNSLFSDDFFNNKDPFENLRNMRKKMEKHMELFGGKPSHNPFDTWFSDRFGGGTANDISKREDEKFIYYDVHVGDLKSTSVNTKIENGYITITGTTEKKSDTNEFKSSFNRTFPLPPNVDSSKMEMTSGGDKITLRFPKTKEFT